LAAEENNGGGDMMTKRCELQGRAEEENTRACIEEPMDWFERENRLLELTG
jgi:hypothetical protein